MRRLLVLVAIGFAFLVQGQLTSTPEIGFSDFSGTPVELFHLHLNKTSFVRGERIWFKAYVYQQDLQKPSQQTNNLHVGIYDSTGKELKRKLIFIENGSGIGDFDIDSTMTGSLYYIKAWTNWMRNFESHNSFYEQIEILNPVVEPVDELISDRNISISFFPEGGSILADTENIVGVKIKTDNDTPISLATASLHNSNGDTLIYPVRINTHGMGKFTYRHKAGEEYYLKASTDQGESISQKLPTATNTGISLFVNTLQAETIQLGIITNEKTRKLYLGRPLELNIQGFDLQQRMEISIVRDREQLILKKDSLSHGINRVFLKDQKGEVITSRTFFNQRKKDSDLIRFETSLNESRDSIEVRVSLKEPSNQQYSLSVAALPSESRVYRPTNTIRSSFLLFPYLQSAVADPWKFLQGSDRRQLYELDMLMLSGGIDVNPFIKYRKQTSKRTFNWESGITLKGWAKNADLQKEQSVWMYSESLQNTFFSDLRSDKTFETNAILYENDSITFSLIDLKGKMRKPEISFSLEPKKEISWVDTDQLHLIRRKQYSAETENWILPYTISDQTIVLDEVELVERRLPERFQINATTELRRISDDDIKRRHTVLNYIRKLGFKVFITSTGYFITQYTNPVMARAIPIIVNGMEEESAAILQTQLSNVETIVFDPQGFIAINLRPGFYRGPDAEPLYIKYPIIYGFARPVEFQMPAYSSFQSNFFKYFGVMDWNPMIEIDSLNSYSYKIPRLGQDKVVFKIEGMGSDGSLYSKEEVIDVDGISIEN